MEDAPPVTGTPIKTKDDAVKLLEELIAKTRCARKDCNVVFPDDKGQTVRWQQKAYQRFLMLYGQALGSLTVLHRVGLLDDVGYNLLRERVMATLAANVVGDA